MMLPTTQQVAAPQIQRWTEIENLNFSIII